MATLGLRGQRYFVQFLHPDTGLRVTISMGTTSKRQATTGKMAIENLLNNVRNGLQLDPQTTVWLSSLKKDLKKRLGAAGLIDYNEQSEMKLQDFLKDYENRRTDAKPLTKTNWQKAFRNLKTHFGKETPINKINQADARAYERYLKSKKTSKKPDAKPLAPATIAKQIGHAKQFFADAVERKVIETNPFDALKVSRGINKSREFFVTREMTKQVVDACPDAQWRLIVALCRYAGLRCPSEVLAVTWDDIDWSKKRIRIASGKTEHHDGGGERIIPLFPELVEPLKDCFDLAGVGIETPSSARLITRYSDSSKNLRTTFEKIIKRAKLKPWPKLFQNLRASLATELVQEFQHQQHVAAAWLGHSIKVAAQHYWQIRDSDFDRAVEPSSAAKPLTYMQRNAAQIGCVQQKTPEKPGFNRYLVAVEGLEPDSNSSVILDSLNKCHPSRCKTVDTFCIDADSIQEVLRLLNVNQQPDVRIADIRRR
jgi:integrase